MTGGVLLNASTGRPESDVQQAREDHLLDALSELGNYEARRQKPRLARLIESGDPLAYGGAFLQDTRPPFPADDMPTITLLTTSLMLWPSATWTPTYATDWYSGKVLHLRCFGKITTAATPSNLTVEIRYGTTDNGGTILATSAALALIANQTAMSWRFEGYVQCRDTNTTTGANGSLFSTGVFECNTAVIAAGQAMIPASAAAAVAVDTAITSGINLQMKRSGSTVETATAQHPIFAALN